MSTRELKNSTSLATTSDYGVAKLAADGDTTAGEVVQGNDARLLAAAGLASHLADASDAHDASAISFAPTAGIAATDVQAAIVEDAGDLAAHLADTTAAHAASAIAFTPAGTIAATTVQAAIEEVAAEAGGAGLPTGGAVNAALVKRGAGDGDADWRVLPVPAPLDPTTAIGDTLYRDPDTVTSLVIGFIGDSITELTPSGGAPPPDQVATALTAHGLTVTVENQGHAGSTTADWLPADASDYLTDAKAAFAGAGVRLVHIMLGTNDAKFDGSGLVAVATYRANLLAIVADLVLAGYIPVVAYPPWVAVTSHWDATSQARLVAYQAEIDSLANGVAVFPGDTTAYSYFAANPGELSDGVHPDATGAVSLGNLWAAALTPYVRGLAGAQAWKALPIGATDTVLKSDGDRPYWGTDEVGSGSAVYPTHATCWHDESKPIGSTTLAYDSNGALPYGGTLYFNDHDANGDAWEQTVALAAGSYTFTVMGLAFAGAPIVDWTLDGSPLLTGQDWYSGSTVRAIKTASVTVATDGIHTLRGTVNGRNASNSAHYWCELQKYWFRQ